MSASLSTMTERPEAEAPYDVTDLVARVIEGERSALAELYDRHHAPLRDFARSLLCDPDVAEDLVHEVFLSLPKVLRRYEARAPLRSFLFSVAANQSRHHVRAAARYRRAKARFAERAARQPDLPDAEVRRQQLAAQLARALDTLPHEQRVAFVLRVVEHRSVEEVAHILEAPPATVRTRVLRARRKLQKILTEQDDG